MRRSYDPTDDVQVAVFQDRLSLGERFGNP